MASCGQCGTWNDDGSAACVRCGAPTGGTSNAPLAGWGQINAPPAGWAPPPPGAAPLVGGLYGYLPALTAWQDGRKLFIPHGAALPDKCVKCNAPAHGWRLERNLTWLHPAYLLTLFTGLLIYLIIAAFATKKATVTIGVCEHHLARRRQAIAGGWGLALLGLGSYPLAISIGEWWPAVVGTILLLVGMFGGILIARLVSTSKIDDRGVWLSGVDRGYLAELPPRPPWS